METKKDYQDWAHNDLSLAPYRDGGQDIFSNRSNMLSIMIIRHIYFMLSKAPPRWAYYFNLSPAFHNKLPGQQ
jgi:hypothetical protein